MLVIISDLHFTDGTTSNWGVDPYSKGASRDEFNVNPKAFKLLIEDIAEIVRRGHKINKVTFVYAGDIFDVLRTDAWFDAKEAARPWSDQPHSLEVELQCGAILESISGADSTRTSLAWLSGSHPDFATAWQADASVDRVYLAGNHDRLVNLYPSCRKWVWRHLLGNPQCSDLFSSQYVDARHSTAVLHGHESDPYNCEFGEDGTPDYPAMPIGDPMATWLFTRLGHEAAKRGMPPGVVRRLRDIDNVRPALATVRYIRDIVREFNLGKELTLLVEEVVEDFEALPFYKEWTLQHDHWNLAYDEADKLQLALRAIRALGTKLPVGMLEKLSSLTQDDSGERLALRCLDRMEFFGLNHCVLGHSHEPLHKPLDIKPGGVQRHYLNSGTFRATLAKTAFREEFISFQRLSYVIIYGPHEFQEDQSKPMYEMWSGLRRFN